MLRKTGYSDRYWGNISAIPYMIDATVNLNVSYKDESSPPKGSIIVVVNYQTAAQRTLKWETKFTVFPVTRNSSELNIFLRTLESKIARLCKPSELRALLAFIKREVIALQDPLPKQAAVKRTVKK